MGSDTAHQFKLTTVAQALVNLVGRNLFTGQAATTALVRAGATHSVSAARAATVLLTAHLPPLDVATGMVQTRMPLVDALMTLAQVGIDLPTAAQGCHQAPSPASAAAPALLVAFPATRPAALAQTLHDAGYLLGETAQGIQAAFPSSTASDLVALLIPSYRLGIADAAQLAQALAHIPYTLHDTATAIHASSVFAALGAPDLEAALNSAFAPLQVADSAWIWHLGGASLGDTATHLWQRVPQPAPPELATALTTAWTLSPTEAPSLVAVLAPLGILVRPMLAALHATFPTLAATELQAALKEAYPPLDPGDIAFAWHLTNASLPEAAHQIAAQFPSLAAPSLAAALVDGYELALQDAPALALALAAVPYPFLDTATALKAVFPDITAAELRVALDGAYPPQTAASLARSLHAQGVTLDAAAQKVHEQFRSLTAPQLAQALVPAYELTVSDAPPLALALAGVPYPFLETATALKAVFPTISATALRAALDGAYPPQTAASLARSLHTQGATLTIAAQNVHEHFGSLTAPQLAQALVPAYELTVSDAPTLAVAIAAVPYPFKDTATALKAVFPDITAAELRAALDGAYPPQTPSSFMTHLQQEGTPLPQAATLTQTQFPDLPLPELAQTLVSVYLINMTDAPALAQALALVPSADFKTTALALKTAFPTISAADLRLALRAAYPPTS